MLPKEYLPISARDLTQAGGIDRSIRSIEIDESSLRAPMVDLECITRSGWESECVGSSESVDLDPWLESHDPDAVPELKA